MNQYIMIRRLRKRSILLLSGVIALLVQLNVLDHFWQWFLPLLLILLGVFMLAERAALATGDGYPQEAYPGQPYAGPAPGSGPVANPGSNLVPTSGSSLENAPQTYGRGSGDESEGGQS